MDFKTWHNKHYILWILFLPFYKSQTKDILWKYHTVSDLKEIKKPVVHNFGSPSVSGPLAQAKSSVPMHDILLTLNMLC